MVGAFEVKSQKILGSLNPQEGVWSIPYEFYPEDPDILSTRGSFFLVVDFETSPNVDLQLAAKIVIDEIKEKYYGDLEGTPLQALEKAVQSGKDKLSEIAKNHSTSITSFNFNLVCAVVWGRVLYIAQVGDTSSAIIRKGSLVDISNKTGGEIITSSGLLQPEDVIIIGTRLFESQFLDDSLTTKIAMLEELITKSPNAAQISVIVISFKKNILPNKRDLLSFFGSLKSKKVYKKHNTKKVYLKNETMDGKITTLGLQQNNQLLNEPNEDSKNLNNKDFGLDSKSSFKGDGMPKKRGRKPKRLFLPFLIVFLFVFIFLLNIKFRFFSLQKLNYKHSEQILSVDFDNAQKDLNILLSKNTSLESLQAFKDKIVSNSNLTKNQKSVLISKLNEKIEEINKENNKPKEIVFDFSVKNNSPRINSISLIKDTSVFVSDSGSDQAYIVDILPNGVKIRDLALGNSYIMAKFINNIYYILLKDSVYVGDSPENLKQISLDKPITDVKDFDVYFGNIYVLTESNILKYVKNGPLYKQTLWTDLPKDINYYSLSVDGNIYIASSKGLLKYYKGEKQDFDISNITSPLSVLTTRDENLLYILDSSNKIYTLDKDTKEIKQKKTLGTSAKLSVFAVSSKLFYASDFTRLYKFNKK